MSTPTSLISICQGVRLNPSYDHTIYFDSLEAQETYFAGKVVKTFPAYTYLRKKWDIKVSATMEQARKWSYLFFKNGNGKTFYYFITNIEYVNDNTVSLTLELDVMQTYHFDYELLSSFVEREHTMYDEVGGNLAEESLEVGEYTVNNLVNVTELKEMCILLLTTIDPLNTSKTTNTITKFSGSNVGGVFSGVGVVATAFEDWGKLADKLLELDDMGVSDAIISIWMYPKALVGLHEDFTWSDGKVTKYVNNNKTITVGDNITRIEQVDGYTPKNKKLLSYPYNFLYVTNNEGGSAVYRYERFLSGSCEFKIGGSVSPEASVKMYPLLYNGWEENYDEGLSGQNYPTCAWNQDTYKLWLAQNQNQQNLGLLTGGAMMVGGAIATLSTGGVGGLAGAGTFVSGASQIASILAQRKDASIQPPQAKGSHSVNVNVTQGYHTFTFMQKSVDYEHARIIDDYFSMYGYRISRVKVPYRNVRERWTYTKTVGCHITGNLCADDLTKIESIYDHGITFWKNGDEIGRYELSNRTMKEMEEEV